MADAPVGQQSSSGRPRGESGARRQTSLRRGRGEPRGGGGEGRAEHHVASSTPTADVLHHHYKPVAVQNKIRNKTWVNQASINASFQSHAGTIADTRNASWRNRPFDPTYRKQIEDLYQTLKENRKRERIKAIKDGFLADPDKPTTLDCAITPVGTCQDMCPEFERVERIMQNTVEGAEKILPSAQAYEKYGCEDIMVKKFRRSAAGYEEQLPSDIRPPLVLQKTLDYLINDVVGGPEPLAAVHGFVWDRTRSIRNDFSIQQVTKIEDVKIAIDCFERIVRFHILSLHLLSGLGGNGGEFNAHQERTQLNNALLSLHHYYEDNHNTFVSPNEAEFRAYAVIFEIQDMRPDVEDRLQNMPKHILKDQRVQTALKLYAAAGNTADQQGPLQPYTRFMTAQANTGGFWNTVQSNYVSYLMACVTEIYFNHVRRTCLKAIWKAYKGKRAGPTRGGDYWILGDLTTALGFDDEEQTRTFCEQEGFTIAQSENREQYIDLGSVDGGNFTDQKSLPKQIFSQGLVESKRLGRTLPAVVNGMSASQARSQGFVEELPDAENFSEGNDESLFVDGDSENEQMQSGSESENPRKGKVGGDDPKSDPTASAFESFSPPALGTVPNTNPFSNGAFGEPQGTSQIQTSQAASTNPFGIPPTQTTSAPFGAKDPTKFDFFAGTKSAQTDNAKASSNAVAGRESPKFDFGAAVQASHTLNTNNSLGLSPFVKSSPTIQDSPPATDSALFPTQPGAISGQLSTSSTITAPGPARGVFDISPASSNPPVFSFGTSPLFQPGTKDRIPTINNTTLPSQKDNSASKTPFSPSLTTSNTSSNTVFPPPSSFVGSAAPSATNPAYIPGITPTSSISASQESKTSKPQQSTSYSSKSITEDLFQPSFDSKLSHTQSTSTHQPPNTRDLFQQGSFIKSPNSAPNLPSSSSATSKLSGSTALETVSGGSKRDRATLPNISSDRQSETLDKLAEAMMLGDQGLLQQFVEFTVGPIIESSIKQLEDEESWQEARECRVVLLSKKFFRKWRANAWNMSLMRKARERRRKFAKSIQDSARSTPGREDDLLGSFRSSVIGSRDSATGQSNSAPTMPPPSTPLQKRQSLPPDFDIGQAQAGAAKGTKRKRDGSPTSNNHRTPKSTRISHQRSHTIGHSIMSAPPHGLSYSSYKPRMDMATIPKGSMLNDILMKQARRLAPMAKSDTTRTDYFRLKALGIDPDTPVVPLSQKRIGTESTTSEDSLLARTAVREKQPGEQSESQAAPRKSAAHSQDRRAVKNDDDEALFAQIRSVREALAESEQWMQSERQSIEGSTTSRQASASPSKSETPAQRRLREIKEKGHQPSRTEVRLRALGDKALLPEGFWDGEGMGLSLMKGKGKEKHDGLGSPASSLYCSGQQKPNGIVQQPMNGLMGFAALKQMNGAISSHRNVQRQDSEEARKGASAEEAIEL